MRYHYKIMPQYYAVMSALVFNDRPNNLIWCADIQKDRKECLYCDRYHYTAAFCRDLAAFICSQCQERKLLELRSLPN